MGYETLWKALADLLTELQRKGETIPNEIINDLRSAKTMIEISKADPARTENLLKIEMYLGNVESHLLQVSQNKLGLERMKHWMRIFVKARRKVENRETEAVVRFVSGLPRNKRWIRIKVAKDRTQEDIESLAYDSDLSCRMQDGYMLVYGNNENLKSFIKRWRENIDIRNG